MTDTDHQAPPVASAARRWAAALLLSASLLVITMDMTILNIALPDMAAELRPTANQQLWIVDVYGFLIAGFLITMGTLGDRVGRRPRHTASVVAHRRRHGRMGRRR